MLGLAGGGKSTKKGDSSSNSKDSNSDSSSSASNAVAKAQVGRIRGPDMDYLLKNGIKRKKIKFNTKDMDWKVCYSHCLPSQCVLIVSQHFSMNGFYSTISMIIVSELGDKVRGRHPKRKIKWKLNIDTQK